MTGQIVRATYADALHVARRMRALDAEEILPLLPSNSPEQLAAYAAASFSAWASLARNSEPVAIIGWTPTLPAVAQVFFFATDRWGEVATRTTIFATKFLRTQLADTNINRAECWALHRHHVAREWLTWLGFKQFGIAHDMGPKRDTYVGYCFTRTQLERGNGHAKGRLSTRVGRGRQPGPAASSPIRARFH